jgi:hypothetical protein
MGELNKVVVNCRVGVELLSSVDRVGVELLSIAVVTVSSCCLVLSKCERYRYKSVVCVCVCEADTAIQRLPRQVQTMRSGVRYDPEQLIDSLKTYVCVSHKHTSE